MKRPKPGALFTRVTCTSFCSLCRSEIRDGIMVTPAFMIICDACAGILGSMADDASHPNVEFGAAEDS